MRDTNIQARRSVECGRGGARNAGHDMRARCGYKREPRKVGTTEERWLKGGGGEARLVRQA